MPKLRLLSLFGVPFSAAILLAAGLFGGVALAAAPACDSAGAPTTTVYLPNITKTLGGPSGWVTPFYIQNSGAIQTTVETSFFRFSDGALIACRKSAPLAPGTSLVDNPDADADLPDDTQFSVVAKSFGAPVVAVVNQLQSSGATQQALSYSGFTSGDTKVYLPNVTRRFFGYDVPFIVQDLGPTSASVSARFISFDGTRSYTRSLIVDPGRSGVVDPDFEPAFDGNANSGLVDGTQYAVTLTSTQPIAVVVNAHNEIGSPVAFSHNGIGHGATTLYAPYAAKSAPPGDTFSPIVVQNLGTTTTDAQLLFTSTTAGAAPQSFTLRAIPVGGSQAFDPRFAVGTTTLCAAQSATCLGAGEYSLKISAANPIAAVVLPNSATMAAGYLAATQLSPRALVPTAFRRIGGANGWNTRMIVYAGTPAQLTVRAFAIPSGDIKATFPIAVNASGAASFDLRTVPGLTDDSQYAVTIDGAGVPLAAIAVEQATTGGDASMIYEAFGAAALSPLPGPASVQVSPAGQSLSVSWTQQFTAAVTDQFGGALAGQPVTWTITPATLGTLTPGGLFTAGSNPGSGTVTATVGAVATKVPIAITVPPVVTLGGLSFWSFIAATADVYAETAIGAAGTQAIVDQVDADVAQVEKDYARAYATRPVTYALSGASSFFKAVSAIGGSTTPTPTWSVGVCICYDPHPNWVFVNWQAEQLSVQKRSLRHEITHMMEHQIAPPTASLPAWFDEGNARLEEFTVASTQWLVALERFSAASMAAQGSLFTLSDLTSQTTWNARTGVDVDYQYAVASQAAQLLRNDLGMAGELRVFDLMAQGQTFDNAYAMVAGRPLSDFATGFASRIRALATGYPGVATAPDASAGPGLTFIVYGLPANAGFTLSIAGGGLSGVFAHTADAHGVYYGYLGSLWPPGSYTISAIWSGGTVSAGGVKTQ